MGSHDEFDKAGLTGLGQHLDVAFENCLERQLVLPLRMHEGERPDAIEREGELGCSTQSVPALSNMAMQSEGAMNPRYRFW
ncbi:hypothetical protein IVB46_12365 [Bradyrhizobium sp. 61]|nr:hypothetical protein [Bradyrhizobium sp. 61]MCK1448824.1 hypothetical protein [Bradyrhizobium sp. 48]